MQNKKFYWPCRARAAALIWLAIGGYSGVTAEANDVFQHDSQLTPERLVEAVLDRNPDVPAMQAAWEAARSRIAQGEAFDDPMLTYGFAPQTAGASGLDFGQKLSISQRLPWPGKRQLRGDAARLEADAAQQNVEWVRLKLAEAARVAFADWYFVHAAIRVNAVNKSLLEEIRNIAQVKYGAGRASKQDALRAEVEVALLEHRDIVLERQRKAALAMLNILLQRQPDAPLPPPSALPGGDALPSVVQLRAMALQNRPDIHAVDARVQAGQQRVKLAERNTLPDFQLSADYNSLWMRDEQRLMVGVGINIPLSAKHRAAEDEARADLLRLDFTRQEAVVQLQGEVQQAYDQVVESQHVLALYQDHLLPLAEENLAAARSDYEAGRGNFLDMIGAEKNLMQARLQLEQARAEHYRRRASLERAVGGPQALQSIQTGGMSQ